MNAGKCSRTFVFFDIFSAFIDQGNQGVISLGRKNRNYSKDYKLIVSL